VSAVAISSLRPFRNGARLGRALRLVGDDVRLGLGPLFLERLGEALVDEVG
jgi:hypothetical protein